MTDELPETRWFTPDDLRRGPVPGPTIYRLRDEVKHFAMKGGDDFEIRPFDPSVLSETHIVTVLKNRDETLKLWQYWYDECAKLEAYPVPVYLVTLDEYRRLKEDDGLSDQIVSEWFRDSCPECHGSGWPSVGRGRLHNGIGSHHGRYLRRAGIRTAGG